MLALLAACGGGGGGSAADSAGPASTAPANATAAPAAPAASDPVSPAVKLAGADGPPPVQTLTVRAHGSLAGNVGPTMVVRVNGAVVGSVEVRATEPQDYVFTGVSVSPGAKVDVAFTNDESIAGQDRNLFVTYIAGGGAFMLPGEPAVVLDHGVGAAAFDGLNTGPGQSALWGNGALRFLWPAQTGDAPTLRDTESSRFLQQATFGPTLAEIERLRTMSFGAWLDEQIGTPAAPGATDYVQRKFDQGPEFLPPNGSRYSPDWVSQKFWADAAGGSRPLRKRVAFALHGIFVVSQVEANLFHQNRAYASYLDGLDRLAFGNFRALIEEVALSPAMGIYLSHMRNMKEDPARNRLPDENFARELMQLFTIGLHELNSDGTPRLDSQGRPIETFSNADVMALAKVFTGWSWGFDDAQLTEANFRSGMPDARLTGSSRVDVRRMKAYPGMASSAEKRLFQGRPTALVIPANAAPSQSVALALDTLFNHPNVGPFIGRQLIQRLVTSNPSPAYVNRVAQAFNNNGAGVRGDMGAVVRAVLLDTEARSAPGAQFGKVREPVLRVAHWMRALGAVSASGEYMIAAEPQGVGQRPNYAPSVFGFFRPGYVPPNTTLASAGLVAPEMQIVDEATVAGWINGVELMLREGLGWFGQQRDVTVALTTEAGLLASSPRALINHLDLLLFAGQMSQELRKHLMDAMLGVSESTAQVHQVRARVAVYIAMTSPEYIVQR